MIPYEEFVARMRALTEELGFDMPMHELDMPAEVKRIEDAYEHRGAVLVRVVNDRAENIGDVFDSPHGPLFVGVRRVEDTRLHPLIEQDLQTLFPEPWQRERFIEQRGDRAPETLRLTLALIDETNDAAVTVCGPDTENVEIDVARIRTSVQAARSPRGKRPTKLKIRDSVSRSR